MKIFDCLGFAALLRRFYAQKFLGEYSGVRAPLYQQVELAHLYPTVHGTNTMSTHTDEYPSAGHSGWGDETRLVEFYTMCVHPRDLLDPWPIIARSYDPCPLNGELCQLGRALNSTTAQSLPENLCIMSMKT